MSFDRYNELGPPVAQSPIKLRLNALIILAKKLQSFYQRATKKLVLGSNISGKTWSERAALPFSGLKMAQKFGPNPGFSRALYIILNYTRMRPLGRHGVL